MTWCMPDEVSTLSLANA